MYQILEWRFAPRLFLEENPPFSPPPPPYSSIPWRPVTAVAPSGKMYEKRKLGEFFWGDPPSTPPPSAPPRSVG